MRGAKLVLPAKAVSAKPQDLGDRLWGCRASGVLALEKLDDRDSIAKIRELLGDDVYDVRAQAAKTLHAFGDPSGLPVLVEALRANTVWFDIDYGQIDGAINRNLASPGFFNGDFNYDGLVDILDYGIIDGTINTQGRPL